MRYTLYFILTIQLFLFSCSPKKILINQDFIVSIYFNNKISKLKKIQDPSLQNLQNLMRTHIEYGYGVIMEKSDRLIESDYSYAISNYKIAFLHFNSARLIGTKILTSKYVNFEEWLNNEVNIIFSKSDVSDLYWLAAAYGGSISSSRGNPYELIHLPLVSKILQTCILLDPKWGDGSLYSAMMSYTSTRSDLNNQDLKDSINHYYKKSLLLSDSLDASLFVSYAELVHKPAQEKERFNHKLNIALKVKSSKKYELINLIAKKRAKWLLSNTEEYFLE